MHFRNLFTALALACAPWTGWAAEDACGSLTPALVGGPMLPGNSDIAVIRWLGNANYEVAFGGKVYLFDTYFDRVARSRPRLHCAA